MLKSNFVFLTIDYDKRTFALSIFCNMSTFKELGVRKDFVTSLKELKIHKKKCLYV